MSARVPALYFYVLVFSDDSYFANVRVKPNCMNGQDCGADSYLRSLIVAENLLLMS